MAPSYLTNKKTKYNCKNFIVCIFHDVVSWLIASKVIRTTLLNEANEWLPHFNEYLKVIRENLKLLEGLTYQTVEYFLLTACHRNGRVVI